MKATMEVGIGGRKYPISPQKRVFLRTDMMLVTLTYNGGDMLIFDRVEGGGRGEALTLYKVRHSDDAADIVHLINEEEPVEVVCQPMNTLGEIVGASLVYQGSLGVVRPHILDANRADISYLMVSLDEWEVCRREPNE